METFNTDSIHSIQGIDTTEVSNSAIDSVALTSKKERVEERIRQNSGHIGIWPDSKRRSFGTEILSAVTGISMLHYFFLYVLCRTLSYQKLLQQVAGKLKSSSPCVLQWLLLAF